MDQMQAEIIRIDKFLFRGDADAEEIPFVETVNILVRIVNTQSEQV